MVIKISVQGGRTSSNNHMKANYLSVLGRKVCGKVTGIKQVSACSIQVCKEINGDQGIEHFCSKGGTTLHCWKVGEHPGYG